MQLGRVVGTVVATQKADSLVGAKLLLVRPLAGPLGTSRRPVVLAVDAAQAGIGDTVLLVIEGRAAGAAVRRPRAPVDAAIIGVVDSVVRFDGSVRDRG